MGPKPSIHQVVAHLRANPAWVEQLGALQIAEIERTMKRCINCVIVDAGGCGHLAERRRDRQIEEMHVGNAALRWLGQYEALIRDGPNAVPTSFTPIEVTLLRSFWAAGLSPETQYKIGPFTVDFAFPERRVVIEADGAAYHAAEKDGRRDQYLRRQGWRVLRFSGSQIMFDADAITDHIYDQVRAA